MFVFPQLSKKEITFSLLSVNACACTKLTFAPIHIKDVGVLVMC